MSSEPCQDFNQRHEMSSASSSTSASSLLESNSSFFSRDTSPGLHRPQCHTFDHASKHDPKGREFSIPDAALSPPNLCRNTIAQSTDGHVPSAISGVAPDLLPTISSGTSVSSFSSAQSESSSGGDDSISPPPNFAEVVPGLYRSSFPREKHFAFIRSLGLKSVLTFVQDEYPEDVRKFYEDEGITFFQIGMPGNKEDDMRIPNESIRIALDLILDGRNFPMLMHCNKGKHRTGVVVGCLRRLQKMPLDEVLQEYRNFSFPKCRTSDQHCIARFPLDLVTSSMCMPPPQWLEAPPTLFKRPASLGQLMQRDSESSVTTTIQQEKTPLDSPTPSLFKQSS